MVDVVGSDSYIKLIDFVLDTFCILHVSDEVIIINFRVVRFLSAI
jgi:hypothetical protein